MFADDALTFHDITTHQLYAQRLGQVPRQGRGLEKHVNIARGERGADLKRKIVAVATDEQVYHFIPSTQDEYFG